MQVFASSFIVTIACFYASSKILKSELNYKSYKYWLIVTLNAALVALSFIATKHFAKVFFNFIVLTVSNKLYFKKKVINTIIASFSTFVLMAIGELLTATFLVLIFGLDLIQSFTGQIAINVAVSLFMILIINYRKTLSFIRIVSESENLKIVKGILPLVIFTVILYPAYFYYLYFESNIIYTMILSVTLIIAMNTLILGILRERNYSANLRLEYNELINNLNEYEKVLEKYRIANHENKNNFVVLRGLLKNEQSNITEYIDEIINNKKVDDEEVLIKTKKLPTGGLQGLIYQKLLEMKEKSIIYNIELSRDIDLKIYDNFDFQLNKNLCTIVGILIDNSIEAVEDLNTKNVGLYIYKENDCFVFSISNTFSGTIDLDKIDNVGYSSKGKGRGYGLSLVKKIIDKDNRIFIQREIVKNIFKQKIKIKIIT